jgi:predicted SpoU family rRNA methylase
MTLSATVNKIEKAFGEKMNINTNGQYYLNGISFYSKNGIINFITVNGSHVNSVTKAFKKFGK